MKVQVSDALCTGHGRCYALAPDVYAPDDRGHCELLHTEIPPGLEQQAKLGVDNCPERAITIADEAAPQL